MSAREELIEELAQAWYLAGQDSLTHYEYRARGFIDKAMDRQAHELAEKIRAEIQGCPDVSFECGLEEAADLIDPASDLIDSKVES